MAGVLLLLCRTPGGRAVTGAVATLGALLLMAVSGLGAPIEMTDGQVTIEAEDADSTAQHGSHEWLSATSPPGAVGSALTATPDVGTTAPSPFVGEAPEAKYQVRFDRSGAFRVFVRAFAPDADADTIHVSLEVDGKHVVSTLRAEATGQWTWLSQDESGTPGVIDVPEPGEYSLSLWMGEDGIHVDRILLGVLGAPTGDGPPASSRDTVPPSIEIIETPGPESEVAVDEPLRISFSEPVSAASLEAATTLTANGSPVPFEVRSDFDGVMYVIPDEELSGNAPHELSVAPGVEDEGGNASTGSDSVSFTTGDPPPAIASGSLAFDGQDDLARTTNPGDLPTAGPFTVSGWFRAHPGSSRRLLVQHGDSTSTGAGWGVSRTGSGQLALEHHGSGTTTFTPVTPDSNWVFFAVIGDPGAPTLHVYDQQTGWRSDQRGPIPSMAPPPARFTIGGADGGTQGFDGELTDFRLYAESRSLADIQSDYRQRLGGPFPVELRGYWPLDDGEHDVARDALDESELTLTGFALDGSHDSDWTGESFPDSTAPSVEAFAPPGGASSATPGSNHVMVEFSEPVTGLEPSDVAISGSSASVREIEIHENGGQAKIVLDEPLPVGGTRTISIVGDVTDAAGNSLTAPTPLAITAATGGVPTPEQAYTVLDDLTERARISEGQQLTAAEATPDAQGTLLVTPGSGSTFRLGPPGDKASVQPTPVAGGVVAFEGTGGNSTTLVQEYPNDSRQLSIVSYGADNASYSLPYHTGSGSWLVEDGHGGIDVQNATSVPSDSLVATSVDAAGQLVDTRLQLQGEELRLSVDASQGGALPVTTMLHVRNAVTVKNPFAFGPDLRLPVRPSTPEQVFRPFLPWTRRQLAEDAATSKLVTRCKRAQVLQVVSLHWARVARDCRTAYYEAGLANDHQNPGGTLFPDQTGSAMDANRHCLWASYLTIRFAYRARGSVNRKVVRGSVNADRILVPNEQFRGNPITQRAMDVWNNRIGKRVGRQSYRQAVNIVNATNQPPESVVRAARGLAWISCVNKALVGDLARFDYPNSARDRPPFDLNPDGTYHVLVRQDGGTLPPINTLRLKSQDLFVEAAWLLPDSGESVEGTIDIYLELFAPDTEAPLPIQYRVDGQAVGPLQTDEIPNYRWDSTTVPNGEHSITAEVTLPGGGSKTFGPLKVTVANGGGGGTQGDYNADGKTDPANWYGAADGTWAIAKSGEGNYFLPAWGHKDVWAVPGDYDADGRTDEATWGPKTGTWAINKSSGGQTFVHGWGNKKERPVPADYDGDGATDLGTWGWTNGGWHAIRLDQTPIHSFTGWGTYGGVPVPADYDGDGKADVGNWYPSSGTWATLDSSTGAERWLYGWGNPKQWAVPGQWDSDHYADYALWSPDSGDWDIVRSTGGNYKIPAWGNHETWAVPGDYDGDGKMDAATWSPSGQDWAILESSGAGYGRERWIFGWGSAPGVPVTGRPVCALCNNTNAIGAFNQAVSGDYNGDGRADHANWYGTSGGTWAMAQTGVGNVFVDHGTIDDWAVPADYDGDGRTDQATWNNETGLWGIVKSTGGTTWSWWGVPDIGNRPVPEDYDGDGKADLATWHPGGGSWWVLRSTDGGAEVTEGVGATGDVAVQADYDGDGRADVGAFTPSTGTWQSVDSATKATRWVHGWGQADEWAVPEDWDGDGMADHARWAPQTGDWHVRESFDGATRSHQWGGPDFWATPADFDADGVVDRAVWHPTQGYWAWQQTSDGASHYLYGWGSAPGVPVVGRPVCARCSDTNGVNVPRRENLDVAGGDYDGDGKADQSLWYGAATTDWLINQSSSGPRTDAQFGNSDYVATPADYDGDGKTDVSVWHKTQGFFVRRLSTGGQVYDYGWGGAGHMPVPEDYDGDGKADLALFQPSGGNWWYQASNNGQSVHIPAWGSPGHRATPGDYDGDGKADIGYVDGYGNWATVDSSTGNARWLHGFGNGSWKALPEDYDGDGRTDYGVFYPPWGAWQWHGSTSGFQATSSFGNTGDWGVPADYDNDGTVDIATWTPGSGQWAIKEADGSTRYVNFGSQPGVPVTGRPVCATCTDADFAP